MDLVKMENILTKDLIDKIYSMIIYEQPKGLLVQIKTYKYKKQYITLCYKYIIQHWNYCFIDALEIFWKLYYISNIEDNYAFWYDTNYIAQCLVNYKNYVSISNYNLYNSEVIRVLNNNNFTKKKLSIKKYITKYILILKDNHIDFIINHLLMWGNLDINYVEKNIDQDESLKNLSIKVIQDAYLYKSPKTKFINIHSIYNSYLI
tara:strand:- start:5466 stop:6080 length:615 start_codon:yes stop_codon:yes gene_type:complete